MLGGGENSGFKNFRCVFKVRVGWLHILYYNISGIRANLIHPILFRIALKMCDFLHFLGLSIPARFRLVKLLIHSRIH